MYSVRRCIFNASLVALSSTLIGCGQSRPHIKYAGATGSRIAYETHGRGSKAVVFVHGWTCDRSFWNRQVPALKEEFRVILIDLPGHGRSDAPHVDYSIPYFAEAVMTVLDDARVRRAVLVGHSLGFSISREAALRHPDRVVALVSSDGAPLRPPTSDAPADVEAWKLMVNGFIETVTTPEPRAARMAFVESMFREDTSAELRLEIMSKTARTPDHVAVSAIRGLSDLSLWKERSLPLPVLAVLAQHETAPPDRAEQWRRWFPRVEYHEWHDVGHFPMMERPSEFNALLIEFLAKQTW